MKRTLSFTAVALMTAASLFAGIESDYNHAYDFSQVKTYAWRPDTLKQKDGALQNSIVDSRVRAEVDRQMAAKGFTQVDSKPDVYITYRLAAKDRTSVTYFPSGGWGYRRWGGWGGGMTQRMETRYTEGTIMLDMIDVQTKDLVWRVVSTKTESNVIKYQQKAADQIEKMFKKFPKVERPSEVRPS